MRERLIKAKKEMDRTAFDKEFYSIINQNDNTSIQINAVLRELSLLGLDENIGEIKYRITEPVLLDSDFNEVETSGSVHTLKDNEDGIKIGKDNTSK